MKKITLILMACAIVAMSSCGNRKKTAGQSQLSDKDNFEIQQLEANLQAQLDSIASLFCGKTNPLVSSIKSGKIELSESEKSIKPDYLIDPAKTSELTTLAQKYRAMSLLLLDSEIASLYGMPDDSYTAALSKLVSDINDPALKQYYKSSSSKSTEDLKEGITNLYNDEVKNGRICLFWEMSGALTIETLYIMSQNIDKFTEGMTDSDADNLTYRLFLAKYCTDQLVAFYPEMESLSKALAPLDVLNAMDMAEFKQQLAEMKGQIGIIRNTLLD